MNNNNSVNKIILKELKLINNSNEVADSTRVFLKSSSEFAPDNNENSNEALISFNVSFYSVPEELESEFKNAKELSEISENLIDSLGVIGSIKVKYIVEYQYDKNDKTDIRNMVMVYTEPYFRFEFDKLVQEIGLPRQILPLRFWENED